MPRGRFLDRDLSTDRQYWSMSSDERNFWDLLVIWLDPFGRIDGDARIIKGNVCPLADDWTPDAIELMLKKFESNKRSNGLGWISRYHSNGKYCLWASGFKEHQKGLQPDREAKGKYDGYSNIPAPPQKLLKMAGIVSVTGDTKFIEELRPEYLNLDVDKEWEECQKWYEDHKKQIKVPKSALRNWLKKSRAGIKTEPKSSGNDEGMTEA